MNNTKLDSALHCASINWAVFPLHYITHAGVCSCGGVSVNPKCKPGKHPYARLAPNGLKNATTHKAIVEEWFTGQEYNIGVATGITSGFWVLDIDGAEGAASLVALETEHGALPETLRVKTGGGGRHYYFRMPDGVDVRNSEKQVGACIDVRGTGGYVVLPGSNHASGKAYEWDSCEQPGLAQIAIAPPWLLTRALTKATSAPISATPKRTPIFQNLLSPDFFWPKKIQDGEGRESFIIRAAGHLRKKGNTQSTIERVLLDYNTLHIDPPLDEGVVLDRCRRFESQEIMAAEPEDFEDHSWPEPRAVTATLPPVPPFDDLLLPPAFRSRVRDIADRMQCPIEFPAVGIMVAAGSVIGNRIGVQPKQKDTGWIELPNLWGAIVGRPGVMKSPALNEIMAPVRALEVKALQNFSVIRAQYEIDKVVYELAKKSIESQIKKGAVIQPGQMPVPPEEPRPLRHLLNDSTYQKLGDVLCGNPHGVMVFQDELSGLLMRLDTEGQESARAFYLQAWDGKQSYTFDRIGRGTVSIPRLCFSMLGGLQPSKLREYLRSAVFGGRGDDGLAQRLQLLVYPDIDPTWHRVDRQPDLAALQAVDVVFDALAKLNPAALGARMPIGDGIPTLCFDDTAQDIFNNWWAGLENTLRKGNRHPALESHLSKYRKLVPTLALLDHLIEGRTGRIAVDSLSRAINWGWFLREHAKRAYAAVTAAAMDSAKALANKVHRGELKRGFTVRDIYRKNWSMLSTPKEAADAVEVLIDAGWLRPYTEKQPGMDGRPTVRFCINPRLRMAA